MKYGISKSEVILMIEEMERKIGYRFNKSLDRIRERLRKLEKEDESS